MSRVNDVSTTSHFRGVKIVDSLHVGISGNQVCLLMEGAPPPVVWGGPPEELKLVAIGILAQCLLLHPDMSVDDIPALVREARDKDAPAYERLQRGAEGGQP